MSIISNKLKMMIIIVNNYAHIDSLPSMDNNILNLSFHNSYHFISYINPCTVMLLTNNDICNTTLTFVNVKIGYEPASFTVHHPQNDREWVHFFRMGV